MHSIIEFPGMRDRTVYINGFSKAYAMTGWRLGYCCAPKPILRQILKLHQFAIMCAPTTSQYAAVEALKNGDEDIARMREAYDRGLSTGAWPASSLRAHSMSSRPSSASA